MKKILSLVLITFLTLQPLTVLAQEVPTVPNVPSVPTAPTAPSQPTAPTAPSQPTAPTPESAPTSLPTPKPTTTPQPELPTPLPTPTQSANQTPSPTPTQTQQQAAATTTPSPTPTTQAGTGNGQVGDTRVTTGDANNTGNITTVGNQNASATPTATEGSIQVGTVGNGSGSTNDTSIAVGSNESTVQQNSAAVNNNLQQSADTGNNDASANVGETFVKTGDANVSGTIVTSVNTNVDGIMVSEFNVADDHTGDIILDFAQACITGCGTAQTTVQTGGNGANSDNTTNVDIQHQQASFQNNDAEIGNTLVLDANSGKNTANANTGGDTTVYTGDANVSANVLTFANNNIAGNVVYGVVNVYGDLVGDIVFPEEAIAGCCGTQNTTAQMNGNGSGSTNQTNLASSQTNATYQTNDAVIDNVLILDAETGENNISGNTGGDNRVYTGDSSVDANVVNIANSNVDGGNWWLVFVNEAGNWVGRILGAPEGSTMAGSQGTAFTTNANGEVIVQNNGNGANSQNTTNVNQENTTTTVQNNQAAIKNTLDLSANTGGNQASNNTGGDSNIITGDANIIANMVNFVNNNIVGNGKLFVTVVNVFGSWVGNFVTPGQQKQSQSLASTTAADSQTQTQQPAQTVTPTPVNQAQTQTQAETTNGNIVTATPTQPAHQQLVQARRNAATDRQQEETTPTFDSITIEQEYGMIENDVAGAATNAADVETKVAGKKVVSINLAWLIFIIPGVILYAVSRKLIKRFARTAA